ncbi:MAG TPA: DivIVA domain-containing protein [Mycobacteriales bacterium]|nr:DivIVA domain-containing protein [Mycobacteriales bacterium]
MTIVAVVLLGIAVLVGVAVLLGMTDSPMSTEPVDRIDDGVPERALTSHDVGRLRFRVGLRGYRMDDVDRALDRLRDALREAEERSDAAQKSAGAATAPATAPPKRPRARKAAPPDPDGA